MTIRDAWLFMAELWRHPTITESGQWKYYSVRWQNGDVHTLFEHVEYMCWFKLIDQDQRKIMKDRLTAFFLSGNVEWAPAENGEPPQVALCVSMANTTKDKQPETTLGAEEDL